MTARAREEIRTGRQLVIFPEGTRRAAGAEPRYRFGVAHLYAEIGVPCIPVALNSGLYWPRRHFRRYPGTIVVEFLPPIPPGLDKNEFFRRLQHDIETATARLIAEGEAGTVADVLVHRLKGGAEPPPYPGIATCYIEFGGAEVAKFDVNFLGGPSPFGTFSEPSLALAASKKEFGASRRRPRGATCPHDAPAPTYRAAPR